MPCLAHSGCVAGFCLKEVLVATASIRSSTPTNFIAELLAAN